MRKFSVMVVVLSLIAMLALPFSAFAQMGEKTIVDIAIENEDFETLVAAVLAADLAEALSGEGPYTVFAPTDEAFEAALADLEIEPADLLADTALLTEILLYHVVEGAVYAEDVLELEAAETLQGSEINIMASDEGVFLNEDVEVVATNIEASNGVIHVIDYVLLPPAEDDMMSDEMGTIVDIAVENEDFETLVAAVLAADLAEALSGEGPYTVFAPTDEAFEAAFEALDVSAEDVLADVDTLTEILLYHVVEGAVYAEDVVELEAAETLQGSEISITVTDEGVFLNDTVQVIMTDIEASNGIIHVIDFVLLPPAE